MDFIERCRTCGGSIAADNVAAVDAITLIDGWRKRHTCTPLMPSLVGRPTTAQEYANELSSLAPLPRCAYVYGGHGGRCLNTVFESATSLCRKHSAPQEYANELSQGGVPNNLAGFAGFRESRPAGSIQERPGSEDLRGHEPEEHRTLSQDRLPPTEEPERPND